MPELLARSVFRMVPSLRDVETVILINAAILYFGAYFVFAIFWRSLKPYLLNPFFAGLALWLLYTGRTEPA